jgi:hypothetical protein
MTMANLSAIAYAIRTASKTSGIPLKLSHIQQLVAAALGHKSLASYQAADEDLALAEAAHVVIDTELVRMRSTELSVPLELRQFVAFMEQAFKLRHPTAKVHDCDEAFRDSLEAYLETEIILDDYVISEMSSCNHDGIAEFSIPVDISEVTIIPVGLCCTTEVYGRIILEIAPERPYRGHQIRVKAEFSLDRPGRSCFGAPSIHFVRAWLDRYVDEPEPEPDPLSFEKALAHEVGLDMFTIEQLYGAAPPHEVSTEGLAQSPITDSEELRSPAPEVIVREASPAPEGEFPAWEMENVTTR